MSTYNAAINYGTRARIGVILPSGNRAAEAQFAAMLPSGVSIHVTRLALTGTSENELLEMARDVESATTLLADVDPTVVLFHCTAVSTYSKDLEASIIQRISDTSDVLALATSQAIVAALRALTARKIVMLSPYPEHINAKEESFLSSTGFEIVRSACIPCATVTEMMAITPDQWISLALDNQSADADAYLMSCTAVRTAEAIHTLEGALGRPVITSNTAAMWHCLRTIGISDPIFGFGRLLVL